MKGVTSLGERCGWGEGLVKGTPFLVAWCIFWSIKKND